MGVKSVTLFDPNATQWEDLSAQVCGYVDAHSVTLKLFPVARFTVFMANLSILCSSI